MSDLVILSEAKNLRCHPEQREGSPLFLLPQEILRFAQNDKIGAQNDKIGAQNDKIGAQNDKIGAQNDKIGAQNDKEEDQDGSVELLRDDDAGE